MLADRDAVEAADLQRRRIVASFTSGDASDPVALSRRPNRAAWGGVALTVLACLGTGVGTLLTDDVPSDWAAEGTVVVRESTGERYLSAAGRLRPVRNDTSLALAGLADPRTVGVDEVRFGTRPVGEPIGIDGAPDRRPTLPEEDVPWWACQRPGEPLALLTAGGPTSGGRALLARTDQPEELLLVVDGRAHPVAAPVARALGYDPAAARDLPPAFTAMLPVGDRLALLPRPAGPPPPDPAEPAEPPAPPSDLGVPGVPGVPAVPAPPPEVPPEVPPAFLAAGTLVQDTGDDARYVADAGQLRPVTGETTLRLLYGGPAPAPVRVTAEERRRAPEGPPLQVGGFPATPPPAVGLDSWVCVTSAGGVLAEQAELPVLGLTPGPLPATEGGAQVWQPPDVASLVRVDTSLRAAVSAEDPLLLVVGGRAHPVPAEETLDRLGFDEDQVRPRPAAWLAVIGRGPALVPLSPTETG